MAGNPFQKIVVAFDGSPDAIKAVRMASSMAKEYGAKLKILHIYSVPIYTYAAPAPMPQVDVNAIEESAKEKARGILEGGLRIAKETGAVAETELLEAPSVVQAVVEFAEKEKCDLIVRQGNSDPNLLAHTTGTCSNV